MRFRRLNKWDTPQDSVGLVYFSQILDEMLFDFSLDTYKASVMHTGLLCAEAIEVIKEIEQGNVKKPNIDHVNAELCSNFEKDPVALALSPLPPTAFFPVLKNPKSSLKEMETVLSLLAVHLSPNSYRRKNETLLLAEITGRQSLSEIRRLARSYVTSLVCTGFDSRCVRSYASEFFYTSKDRIEGPAAIGRFFSLFPLSDAEFNVIFSVDAIFEHLADPLSALGLAISREIPHQIKLADHPAFENVAQNRLFAAAAKVKAKDIFSARSAAEYKLKLSATLLNLFHHKENPSWSEVCIVQAVTSGDCQQISSPINAMHKCADLNQPVASKRLKALLSDFSLEIASFSKFIRSAQLHSMALASNSYENQILNLWISLESLIPSETKSEDSSNIEHVVDSLLPFLNLGYLEKLLQNFVKDLIRWDSLRVRKLLKKIEGKKLSEKLAHFMILNEYEVERASLKASFRDCHILMDRFDFLCNLVSEPSKAVAALDAHKLRLSWQIRRIYRTRNIIVHSGRTPAYTKSLIEHTHDYLDTVLTLLVRLASNPKSIHSVSQGFKYVELKYRLYYGGLAAKGAKFDSSNIQALLFQR